MHHRAWIAISPGSQLRLAASLTRAEEGRTSAQARARLLVAEVLGADAARPDAHPVAVVAPQAHLVRLVVDVALVAQDAQRHVLTQADGLLVVAAPVHAGEHAP